TRRRRCGRGPCAKGRDDPHCAVDPPPPPPVLGGAPTVPPGALSRHRAAAALCLHAVWRGPADLRRRALRADRAGARRRDARPRVSRRAGGAPAGDAGRPGDAATRLSAALPSLPARRLSGHPTATSYRRSPACGFLSLVIAPALR